MTNYAVSDYVVRGTAEAVAAALETKIETIDATKTLRLIQIEKSGNEFVGILIYDA